MNSKERSSMTQFRVGLTGAGFIGFQHALSIVDGKVPNAILTGIVARSEATKKNVIEKFGPQIKIFNSDDEMFSSQLIDGVIIATPHFAHPEQGINAFQHNLHVLMEKPVGVYPDTVRELNQIAQKSNKKFALMFNLRAKPIFKKIKNILDENTIGKLQRVHWNITEMYRSQAYYDSNAWRATWQGEGGGVLINQGSHYLDLFQWYFGNPKSIKADCHIGRYRNIEVEDDVTAYFKLRNGADGVIHLSTGEVCGLNRLEIVGDAGKIIQEGLEVTLFKSECSGTEFNKKNKDVWAMPTYTKETIKLEDNPNSHADIISNWVQSCRNGADIIVPGLEGLESVLLANAMYLSSWKNTTIDFPFTEDEFCEILKSKINPAK
jgi:predicted dehydrogenase